MINLVETKGLSTSQVVNSLVGYRSSTWVKKSCIMVAHYIPYLFLGCLFLKLVFSIIFKQEERKVWYKNIPTIFKNSIIIGEWSVLIKRILTLNDKVSLVCIPCMTTPFNTAFKSRLLWSRTFWWAISIPSPFYYYYCVCSLFHHHFRDFG